MHMLQFLLDLYWYVTYYHIHGSLIAKNSYEMASIFIGHKYTHKRNLSEVETLYCALSESILRNKKKADDSVTM